MELEAVLETFRIVPLPRLLIALAALGVPPLMFELGYSHYRGNFHRWGMYVGLVTPPLFAAAAFLLLMTSAQWAWWTFAVMAVLLLFTGVLGFFFHVQGVARQTGGFRLDNVMVGPPLVAPLSFSLLAFLGLVSLAYWEG